MREQVLDGVGQASGRVDLALLLVLEVAGKSRTRKSEEEKENDKNPRQACGRPPG